MKLKRIFSFHNLKKQLTRKTKLSEFGQKIKGETDLEHLLEYCEQIGDSEYIELHQQKKGNSTTKSTEEENQDFDKYKIPSSTIVLKDKE